MSRFVCDCRPELKFNVDAIDILIRSHLLNMREFDLHLVQVPQIFNIFTNILVSSTHSLVTLPDLPAY